MQSAGARRRAEQQEETTRNSPNPPRGTNPRRGTPAGTYVGAKAKDPKLDSYIKARNAAKKGSPEYNAAQNKINKAYGKGPTNRPTGRSGGGLEMDSRTGRPVGTGRPAQSRPAPAPAPVKRKEAKPVATSRPTPTIKKPAAPKSTGTQPPTTSLKGDRMRERADKADQRMKDRRNRRAKRKDDRAAKKSPGVPKLSDAQKKKLDKDINRPMMYGGKKMSYTAGGEKKKSKGSLPDLTGDGKITRADVLKGRGVFKSGGGMSGLSAAQKQVYKRGLAAYMSSGNRPKTSQHAWAMARVKSDFGKKEAAKIRSGKSGKSKKK
jgi:hypothetical protein